MLKGFLIPVEGPCREVEIPEDDSLATLQGLVGGYIEAVDPVVGNELQPIVGDEDDSPIIGTTYVNEDGIARGLPFNGRATDFMVPGVGIMFGDYIKGDMVLFGLNTYTGEPADVPDSLVRRARLIEREAR